MMVDGLGGELLTGLVTAGAFAAFLSTSSGLAIAVAGVLSQDVTARPWRAAARRRRGVPGRRGHRGRRCPCVVALPVPNLGVARAVGLAFAMAASTFCPLLLLGIWWRGLTDAGAIAGLRRRGLGSGSRSCGRSQRRPTVGWADALMGQPAAWTVPLALVHDGRRLAAHHAHRIPRPRRAVPGAAAHPGDGASSTAAERRQFRRTASADGSEPGRSRRSRSSSCKPCRATIRSTTRARADADHVGDHGGDRSPTLARARSAKCPGASRYGDTASPGRTTSAGPRAEAGEGGEPDRATPRLGEVAPPPASGRAAPRGRGSRRRPSPPAARAPRRPRTSRATWAERQQRGPGPQRPSARADGRARTWWPVESSSGTTTDGSGDRPSPPRRTARTARRTTRPPGSPSRVPAAR